MSESLSVVAPPIPVAAIPSVPASMTINQGFNRVLAACHRAERDTMARQLELTRSAIRFPVHRA